jgi:asparagine synthase (glutamine-hydrolysing)
MPGIVGIISERSPGECELLVRTMVTSMQHENFYTSGAYCVEEMGVYSGWVAHEESFAAEQVFFNEQRDIALILSGQCFVDLETRTDLTQKGHHLEQAAGSWLVHLYEEESNRFFEKLNGLFSGLLIDKRQGKAFLFNDRYGVERIYWHGTEGSFFFASEAKALLRVLPELREFDQEGVAQFLAFGCTLGQRTLFRGVQLLPGASVWSFENGSCQKKKYFCPATWESQSILSAEAFVAEFKETFQRILPHYFESESRIGISLTGGQDSRMIMACLPKEGEKPVCYTFSGENRDTLDALLAAQVAKVCGLEHQILRIGADFFSDFASHVDRTVYVTDGCLGSLGAHEIYFNNQARALSPVRLTGNFGGEILRGVSMFKPLYLTSALFNADLADSVTSCRRQWSHDGEHPITFAAFHETPEQRFGIVAPSRSQTSFRTPYLDNEIVALAYKAPRSVRTSIDCTLSLVKANNPSLSKIPTDMGGMGAANRLAAASRRIFSKAVCKLDYLRSEGLPRHLSRFDPLWTELTSALGIAGLHKYLPYRVWFQRELAAYVDGTLKNAQVRHSSLWDSRFLEHMASDHATGYKNYMREIDAVLTLDAVERLLFRDLSGGATLKPSTPARVTEGRNMRSEHSSHGNHL